jgi:DNA-directed RNA polymerase specialized sigma24 family protein
LAKAVGPGMLPSGVEVRWPLAVKRDLTQDQLERLLERLGDTRTAAGERYNSTRARLIQFFRWQQVTAAEDLADEVLNRVARRLSEGEEIPNLPGYVHGVARLVALEARDRQARERRAYDEHLRQQNAPPEPNQRMLDCLDRCLATLSQDRRDHLLAYYTGDQSARIGQRARLATALGVGAVALRNRMLRLRQRLEACVKECLDSPAERDGSAMADTLSTRARIDTTGEGE